MGDVVVRPDWHGLAASTTAGGYAIGAGGLSNPPAARSVPADLPAALRARWSEREAGSLAYRVGIAQNAAATILGGLMEENRADLVAAVDSLPEGVRAVVFEELGQGVSGHVREASEADINAFTASEIGHQLVREWGGRAPKRVATYIKRADRMLGNMTDDGVGAFMLGFVKLDPETVKAFIREVLSK